MPGLTSEQRLEQLDTQLDDVKEHFIVAVETVAREPSVDATTFHERLRDLVGRINQLRDGLQPEDFDKDQIVELARTYIRIRDRIDAAADAPDLDLCNDLLVDIERIRHVVRDALDEHVAGIGTDRGLVLADLRAWLPDTPQHVLAELLDVDRRTLSRWAKQAGPPSMRLAIVASLVAILRHAWTEPGVVAWFDRPREDLGGKRARSLLDDPSTHDALIAAARSGRSQYAA